MYQNETTTKLNGPKVTLNLLFTFLRKSYLSKSGCIIKKFEENLLHTIK